MYRRTNASMECRPNVIAAMPPQIRSAALAGRPHKRGASRRISKPPPSATRPPLQTRNYGLVVSARRASARLGNAWGNTRAGLLARGPHIAGLVAARQPVPWRRPAPRPAYGPAPPVRAAGCPGGRPSWTPLPPGPARRAAAHHGTHLPQHRCVRGVLHLVMDDVRFPRACRSTKHRC